MVVFDYGWRFFNDPIHIGAAAVHGIILLDVAVALGLGPEGEPFRFSRVLRPLLLLLNSPVMRKLYIVFVRCLWALTDLVGIYLVMLVLWMMFGITLFQSDQSHGFGIDKDPGALDSYNNNLFDPVKYYNGSSLYPDCHGEPCAELDPYVFQDFQSPAYALVSLFVLGTRENYPDVGLPAYLANHYFMIYFILFMMVFLFFFENIIVAIVYDTYVSIQKEEALKSKARETMALQAAFSVMFIM